MERTKNVHKIYPLKKKKLQSGSGASLRYINPELYFKTIRINVIIYRFSLVDKASRKRRRI